MKRFLAIILLLGMASVGDAATIQDTREVLGGALSPFIESGCMPTVPASSLTFSAFACRAHALDGNVLQSFSQSSASVTLTSVNGTHWLAVHKDTFTAVGGWSRVAFTHYLSQQNATRPADPAGGLVFANVTVAGNVISAMEFTTDRVISETENFTSNRAFTTDTSVRIPKGGMLNISAGMTVTACVDAGPYQIVTGSGSLVFPDGCMNHVFIEWWGGAADDSTDNSTALQSVFDAAKHITLPCGIIRFSQTLTINEGQVLEGCGLGADSDFGTGTALRYTGSGVAIQVTEIGGTFGNQTLILRNFTLRATTGTIGIHITNVGATAVVADVMIDHVSVFGRLGLGGALTGFSTAGLFLEATGTGFVIVVRIQNSYFQANAGDGIRSSGNVNQVSIHQCRIQGNQAWGINVNAVEPRGWSITNSDIEGNTSGSIKSTGPLGLNITGNYFEGLASTDLIQLEGNATNPASGVSIQGNIMQVGANGTGIRLGTATALEGVVVEGNTFTGVTSAVGINFSAVGINNSVLGPNRFISGITANNSYLGRPGAGTTIYRDGNSTVLVTDSSVTAVTVANTTTETNIVVSNLPAYTIDAASGFRIIVYGEYTNNSGAGANLTARIRYQGTLMATLAVLGAGASASPRSFMLSAVMQGSTANTTTGVLYAHSELGSPVALGSGSAPTITVATNNLTIPDSSSPGGGFAVSVQHSVASANITFTMRGYVLESLPQ